LATERRRREYEQRKRDLRRELGVAQAAEQRADSQVERAEVAERDAEHLVEDLDAELAELERRRTEAQADVARRKLARRTTEREAAAARRRVGDVQAALEDLEADEPG
jgi:chromosome segregation ATPase